MSKIFGIAPYLATMGLMFVYFPRFAMQAPASPTTSQQSAGAGAAASTAVPGATSGVEITDEVLQYLLTAPPPLRGFHNKTGMLAPEKWLPEFVLDRLKYLERFKNEAMNETVDYLKQPESKLSRCLVYVNHDYKFLWTRPLKTGSTSIGVNLGKICRRPEKLGKDCGTTFDWSALEAEPGDAERLWKEYFVFTVVRNPYSRFASAFEYLKPRYPCVSQKFGDACKDPFLREIERYGPRYCYLEEFYFRHIREQTHCLFNEEGGVTVDFVANTESLDDDFVYISQEINKRRNAGVPPMKERMDIATNINSAKKPTATYADVFKKYPHCLSYLDTLLAREFEDLGYVTRQWSSSGASVPSNLEIAHSFSNEK